MRKCNDTYSLDRRTEKGAAGTTLLVLLAAVMIPASVSCDTASLENTPSSPISFDAAPLSKAPVENVDEITGFDVWGWNYSTAGAADAELQPIEFEVDGISPWIDTDENQTIDIPSAGNGQ